MIPFRWIRLSFRCESMARVSFLIVGHCHLDMPCLGILVPALLRRKVFLGMSFSVLASHPNGLWTPEICFVGQQNAFLTQDTALLRHKAFF